jgi:palmitoyltransferase
LSREQALWFNVFVLAIWWCYDRACTVVPAPKVWVRKVVPGAEGGDDEDDIILEKGVRWCKKCDAVKPPRAHHCKKCGRYAFSRFP